MARLQISPDVANRFITLDWSDEQHDPTGFCRDLIDHYEAGDIIILKHAPFRIDFDLLNKVDFPAGRKYQKLGEKAFVWPKLHRAGVAKLFMGSFLHRPGFYLAFRREVKSVSSQLREFAKHVFAPYQFGEMNVSWRFTPTGPEGLHVDYFRADENVHHVRIFINIDAKPRIWTVGHQLDELIGRFYEEARLDELRAADSKTICNRLNKTVLGDVNKPQGGALDRHVVEFEQGDVWLCETRINSHQIFSGHRLVATDFYVNSNSMLDPSRAVEARVRRTLERHAALRSGEWVNDCANTNIS